jgi:hypothetical protein
LLELRAKELAIIQYKNISLKRNNKATEATKFVTQNLLKFIAVVGGNFFVCQNIRVIGDCLEPSFCSLTF